MHNFLHCASATRRKSVGESVHNDARFDLRALLGTILRLRQPLVELSTSCNTLTNSQCRTNHKLAGLLTRGVLVVGRVPPAYTAGY